MAGHDLEVIIKESGDIVEFDLHDLFEMVKERDEETFLEFLIQSMAQRLLLKRRGDLFPQILTELRHKVEQAKTGD